MQVTPRTRIESVQVAADATGVVSHAGSAVLVGLADRLGLTAGLAGAWPRPGSGALPTSRAGCSGTWP